MAVLNLSFADYNKLEAWSNSALKAMRKGPPARVLWERANPSADTDDTRRGTAVHAAFIQPEVFAAGWVQKPEGMNFSTKEGKAWKAERQGVEILSFDEYALVEAITAALHGKAAVAAACSGSPHREVTLTWTDDGEACKARPDWMGHEGAIYDLKVSRHAIRPASLAYHAYAEGWMHQLAWYRRGAQQNGIDIQRGRLAVVAPKAPHYVYCLEVKPDSLDLLALDNAATLSALRECRIKSEWTGTPDSWTFVEPPPAALVEAGVLDSVEVE